MIRLLPIAALACAACTPMPAPEGQASPETTGVQCDATSVQSLVGRAADEAVVDGARKRSGSRTVRRYVIGSPLTMDLRPDRLNVEVDAGGNILKLSCG